MANIRAAYAEVVATGLTDPNKTHSTTVVMKQTKNEWQTSDTNIAGISLSSLNSIATNGSSVSIVYNPATSANDANVTIGGVSVPSTTVN